MSSISLFVMLFVFFVRYVMIGFVICLILSGFLYLFIRSCGRSFFLYVFMFPLVRPSFRSLVLPLFISLFL